MENYTFYAAGKIEKFQDQLIKIYFMFILLNSVYYISFVNKEKKKGTNNITAIYVTLHLVLLVIAIVVG